MFCVMHEIFHADENNILLILLSRQKNELILMNRKKQ